MFPRAARMRADGGFTLMESIVGLTITVIVATAFVPFLTGSLQIVGGLSTQERAVAMASQQLELVRSIAPGKLLNGRNIADVRALNATPGLVEVAADTLLTLAADPTAAVGSPDALVPPTLTRTEAGTDFTVRTYIEPCYLSAVTGTCTSLLANGALTFRVSVDVSWPRSPGARCRTARTGQCEYVVMTLVDPSLDPVFTPLSTPVITGLTDASGYPVPLIVLHPGQQFTLRVQGTGFASGATVQGGSGDRAGVVTGATSTALTVPFLASATTGARTLTVTNPDGSQGTFPMTVTRSTPAVTTVGPASVPRNSARTFTVTGLDFFATPRIDAPTTQPTVTVSGVGVYFGFPFAFTPAVSGVSVTSTGSLQFVTTLPWRLFPYVATLTVTVTNPDGGSGTGVGTVTAS